MSNFADRLCDAIRRKNAPVCVGIDPQLKSLPPALKTEFHVDPIDERHPLDASQRKAAALAIVAHGRAVIEVVAPLVPAVKINIAFFEPFFDDGLRAYHELVRVARNAGLLVIGDIKRADIGHTSQRYAVAHLGHAAAGQASEDFATADAVTINPYFGLDSVKPFIDQARDAARGVFVLVQTSNPSAVDVQGLALADGAMLSDRVAHLVQTWAAEPGLIGASGYSCVGAVVAPRDIESTRRLRLLMPNCLFLVPGFGAQGMTAADVAHCFKLDASGAVVNASRSVIYAHENPTYRQVAGDDWKKCMSLACADFVGAVRVAVPRNA